MRFCGQRNAPQSGKSGANELKRQITASADQAEAARFKTQLQEAQAKAKTAGMQASALRRKYGVPSPSQRVATNVAEQSATSGNQQMIGDIARAIQGGEEVSIGSIQRDYKLGFGEAQQTFDAARSKALEWNKAPLVAEMTCSPKNNWWNSTIRWRDSPRMEPPTVEDQLTAVEQQQLKAVEKIRQGLTQQWGQVIDRTTLPKGAYQALETEVKRLSAEWQQLRAAAVSHAGARADFSMLDYGLKRGFDTYVGAFAPYYYWSTRQGRNFAVRLMEHPQAAGELFTLPRRPAQGKRESRLSPTLRGWLGNPAA